MKKDWIIGLMLIGVVVSTVLLFETSESEADFEKYVLLNCEHGTVINTSTGEEYTGGMFEEEIKIKFIPEKGFEFLCWNVSGSAQYAVESGILDLIDVSGEVVLSTECRVYSTSNNLITTISNENLPKPGDQVIMNWSFSSASLDKSHDPWVGTPSTPLIVGDRVFVHAGNYLYALDINNGSIIKSVPSEVVKNEYYYYVSYGNGIILDTIGHKAYDLDLNYLFDIPTSLKFATYSNGYFYGCTYDKIGYHMYKTSADPDSDLDNGVKVNLFKNTDKINIFGQYGQFSGFVIKNDWIFYLGAEINGAGRYIYAYNTITEEIQSSDLTGCIANMLWDDGWLSEYNDYFYVTTYVAGLFDGVSSALKGKYCTVLWIKFDFERGMFESPSYKEIQIGNAKFKGIASNFVIYKGHGYINVRSLGTDTTGGSDDIGTSLISFNIAENGEPIPICAASSSMTHGGIVLNTAYEDEGKLYIYLIPYNPSKCVYVFADTLIDGEWVLDKKATRINTDDSRIEYCSQAIRAGPNGEMIYFLDTGYIDCYLPVSKFESTILVMDNDYARLTKTVGGDITTAVYSAFPQAKLSDGKLILGDKSYTIYALNEVDLSWTRLSNLDVPNYTSKTLDKGMIAAYYRYIILLEDGATRHFYDSLESEKGWYYNAGDHYAKCVLYNYESLNNIQNNLLFYSNVAPTFDQHLVNSYVQVERDSSITIDLPLYTNLVLNVDKPEAIAVSHEGSSILVGGILETTVLLSISLDGHVHDIVVEVTPKISTIGDKTIVESIVEKETETGKSTEYTTVERTDSSQHTIQRIENKDFSDHLLNITEIDEHVLEESYVDEMENPVKETTRTEIITDSEGTIQKNLKYVEEKTTYITTEGSNVTLTFSLTNDKLKGEQVSTKTIVTTHGNYTMMEMETRILQGDNIVSEITDFDIVDNSEKCDITAVDGGVIIQFDDAEVSDLSFVLTMLQNSGKDIIITTGETINADSLDDIATVDATVHLNSGNSELLFKSDVIGNFEGTGDLTLSISDSAISMTSKQKEAAGNARVFSIELTRGDVEQHEFGTFTLALSYDLDLQEGKELKVWRIGDNGEKTYATNVQFKDGKVSFTADHLSLYAIGYESAKEILPEEPVIDPAEGGSDGGNNNGMMIYAGIGVVAILAILGIALVVRRSRA